MITGKLSSKALWAFVPYVCLLISPQATTRCSSFPLEPPASASESRWPHVTTLVSLFDFEDQRNKWVQNSVITNKCLSAAIKNLRGEYYLNGHWVIEFSRATPIAGTMLYYQRGAEGDNVPETIIGRGPTTEPLVVEVRSHRYKLFHIKATFWSTVKVKKGQQDSSPEDHESVSLIRLMYNPVLSAHQPGTQPGGGVWILPTEWTLKRGLLLELWILVCLQQRMWFRSEKHPKHAWKLIPETLTCGCPTFLKH